MIISYLIQLGCANMTAGDACHKASEAFVKQSGLEQNFSAVESWSRNEANRYAKAYLGDDVMKSGAVAYGAYHTVVTRTLTLKCPTFGIANSITSEIHPDSSKLTIEWKF